MTEANQRVETNRRPAIPLDAGRKCESASCAPPSPTAAVAHPYRSTTPVAVIEQKATKRTKQCLDSFVPFVSFCGIPE